MPADVVRPKLTAAQQRAIASLLSATPAIDELGARFAAAGESLALVGGPVRDAFLARANTRDLDFATSGEITHIYVKEGQHVSEDQLLATIDDSSQKVDLAEAKADLQSAQDTLDEVQSGSST